MSAPAPGGRVPGSVPAVPPGREQLLYEGLEAVRRGWVLVPADGKKPALKAWQERTATSEDEVRAWVAEGLNLSVVCGPASGLCVIDEDRQKGGSVAHLGLPVTTTVESGGGGRQYYFAHHDGVGCRKLAENVDVRGEGGAAVLPGSVHPVTGRLYRWELPPTDAGIAQLPEEIAAMLAAPKQRAPLPPPPARRPDERERARRWALSALASECQRLSSAPEGSRNPSLNLAAFRMGQLVGSGLLDDPTPELVAAALASGLEREEAQATCASGLEAGKRTPRWPALPDSAAPAIVHPREARAATAAPAPVVTQVLVPGYHIDDEGQRVKQGNANFADQALDCFPPGLLYRRAYTDLVGVVSGSQFRPVDQDSVRLLADPPTVELFTWDEEKVGKSVRHVRAFVPCTLSNAGLILSRARTHKHVRELHYVARWPVYGADLELVPPGFHAETGVLADYEPVAPEGTVQEALAVLRDIVVDFPFEDEDSFSAFIALQLTVVLRLAVDRVPFFLNTAPVHGSGKTLLFQEVIGRALLGHYIPGGPIPDEEDEREKRITALSISGGTPVIFLDNLPESFESHVIASMVTMPVWSGRQLGQSTMIEAPMNSILIGTGNNTRLSGELARRAVPIRLTPGPHPETRTNFRHAISEYAPTRVRAVRAALLSLVEHWKRAGAPRSRVPFGSFERWSAIIGGVLEHAGLPHLRHLSRWRAELDPEGQALEALADRIVQEWGYDVAGTAAEILPFARGQFQRVDDTPERRQAQALGTILSRSVGRHLQYGTLRSRRTREGQAFYMENPRKS